MGDKADEAKAVDLYRKAVKRIDELGFGNEADQEEASARMNLVSEVSFLYEYAWVVLCSGFRWSVVENIFPSIGEAFEHFHSARWIVRNADLCVTRALVYFKNERKLNAIVSTAEVICEEGFDKFRGRIRANPLEVLRSLKFIGPVTVYHLAKNLGFEYAKPDRHLLRIAERLGFGEDVQGLCATISRKTGASIPRVDIVLWRTAELGEVDRLFGPTVYESKEGK